MKRGTNTGKWLGEDLVGHIFKPIKDDKGTIINPGVEMCLCGNRTDIPEEIFGAFCAAQIGKAVQRVFGLYLTISFIGADKPWSCEVESEYISRPTMLQIVPGELRRSMEKVKNHHAYRRLIGSGDSPNASIKHWWIELMHNWAGGGLVATRNGPGNPIRYWTWSVKEKCFKEVDESGLVRSY